MAVKFAYENIGKVFFGHIYRPIAKVSFKSLKSNIWAETWMIIDTGADFTILPRYLSSDLEVSLGKDCIKDETVGVGGKQTIYLCKLHITVKIGSMQRSVPIAFFDNNEIPALLGRLGFLETFDTEFLKKHVVIFKD